MGNFYNYINIHTHKIINTNSFELVNSNDVTELGFFSVGIHPWDIASIEVDYSIVENLISLNNVLAIGEIGIDRAINTDVDLQKQVFFKQLQIAKINNKPVILHCVRAYSDFQQIVKQYPYTYIFHGFNSNINVAYSLIKFGSYLSFGEQLLKSSKLQSCFKQLPPNNIFLETDESNVNIKDIYIFASKLLNISLTELQEIIQCNFKQVFGIDVRKLAK